MITIYVTYPGDAEARFDRTYYIEQHIPLVMKTWRPHGLLSAAAFFPERDGAGTIAICECQFKDQAAVEACFAAPETAEVMADVALFTDVSPARLRGVTM